MQRTHAAFDLYVFHCFCYNTNLVQLVIIRVHAQRGKVIGFVVVVSTKIAMWNQPCGSEKAPHPKQPEASDVI